MTEDELIRKLRPLKGLRMLSGSECFAYEKMGTPRHMPECERSPMNRAATVVLPFARAYPTSGEQQYTPGFAAVPETMADVRIGRVRGEGIMPNVLEVTFVEVNGRIAHRYAWGSEGEIADALEVAERLAEPPEERGA